VVRNLKQGGALVTKIQKIADRIAALQEELKTERENLRDAIRNSLVFCTCCNKKSKLIWWRFLQDMYYNSPQGHEGGYWSPMETRCCHIKCPKCGAEIYICIYPEKDRLINLIDSYKFNKADLFYLVEQRKRD
jgi:hypothetical protein